MKFLSKSLFVFILLAASTSVYGQTTANLTGTVTTGGTGLPGATVTVTSPSLQGSRTAVTGDAGGYSIASLPPGEYTVRLELEGLQAVTRTTRLQLGQTSRVDADLRVSAVAEAITVTASAPSVLETSQIASTFTAKQIEELPIGRTVQAAALMAPGVSGNTLSANQFQISGSPGYDNLVMVNGVVVTENVRSQVQNLFIEDAIQETTILTGAISAEYGRFTGGVVNSITKSGGNDFSGSLRDTLTNPSWTEKTPFATQKDPIDKLDNVYEGTVGGRIIRDRLWFFGAGRLSENSTQSSTLQVTSSTIPERNRPALNYTNGIENTRYEVKLTGQLHPRHSLVGSYLNNETIETNNRFLNVYDLASLTDRTLPNALKSLHYSGVITSNFLVEGQYSQRTFAFVGSGSKFTDLVKGTLLLDRSNGNARFNAPTFCGVCADETRDNKQYLIKGSYFLSTKSLGNHNIVAGYDDFSEQRFSENHQSGSDFRIFATSAFFAPNGDIYPQFESGRTFIRWTPIFVAGNENNLTTQSIFVNDKWDLNQHLSFNIGARFDKNDSVDATGTTASDDEAISPRLTAIYDIRGDGRNRITASYNTYVSRLVEGIATSNQSSGTPGTIDFLYTGPAINPNSSKFQTPIGTAIQQLFDFFNKQCDAAGKCGTANLSLLRPGGARSIPGASAVFLDTLKSPAVDEITVGYAMALGRNGFAKIDLIARDWRDFYASELLPNGPEAQTSLGIPVDLTVVRNSDEIERTYRGLQLQTNWRPARFNLGFNYTLSELRGNDEGETAGSGPVANQPLSLYYPEFLNYEQRLPVGPLAGDQRHRLRAWAGYDLPLGVIGNINVSILQHFDSGRAYNAIATIDADSFPGAPANPGYAAGSPATSSYYLGGRGAFRFEDSTRTDLAINYGLPIWKGELFVQADLLNAFNEDAITGSDLGGGISTTVTSSGTSTDFAPFNPFTVAPVACPQGTAAAACKTMGANYQLSSNFGKPTTFEAYQLARTYRVSLGLRF